MWNGSHRDEFLAKTEMRVRTLSASMNDGLYRHDLIFFCGGWWGPSLKFSLGDIMVAILRQISTRKFQLERNGLHRSLCNPGACGMARTAPLNVHTVD